MNNKLNKLNNLSNVSKKRKTMKKKRKQKDKKVYVKTIKNRNKISKNQRVKKDIKKKKSKKKGGIKFLKSLVFGLFPPFGIPNSPVVEPIVTPSKLTSQKNLPEAPPFTSPNSPGYNYPSFKHDDLGHKYVSPQSFPTVLTEPYKDIVNNIIIRQNGQLDSNYLHIDIGGEGPDKEHEENAGFYDSINVNNPETVNSDTYQKIPNLLEIYDWDNVKLDIESNKVDEISMQNIPLNSKSLLSEIARIIKPTGVIALWVDKNWKDNIESLAKKTGKEIIEGKESVTKYYKNDPKFNRHLEYTESIDKDDDIIPYVLIPK